MLAPIIKGLILGVLLSISIGPIIFAIIKQSINNGHKAGYFFVAGVSASDITFIIICNFFTTLFAKALNYSTEIAVTGSIFLVAVGIYTLFFKKVTTEEGSNLVEKKFNRMEYVGIFISGYLMNILNPGVLLFWFAWTAVIVGDAASTSNPTEYKFTVFIVCLLFVLITDIAKVAVAGKLRSKLTPKNLHLINILSGIILIGFGIVLCWGVLRFGDSIK